MHRARLVGHRHNQAGAVLARRRRHGQCLRQAHHRKTRTVKGVVLNGVGGSVQRELRGSTVTCDARPVGVSGGQACTFGIAGGGASFNIGQVRIQLALALRKRLRVCINGFNAFEGRGGSQQVVPDHQT